MRQKLGGNKNAGAKIIYLTAPEDVWSRKLICECDSSFNKFTYYKNLDNNIFTYYYQCYNQKNNGSLNYIIKKGLDITDDCYDNKKNFNLEIFMFRIIRDIIILVMI